MSVSLDEDETKQHVPPARVELQCTDASYVCDRDQLLALLPHHSPLAIECADKRFATAATNPAGATTTVIPLPNGTDILHLCYLLQMARGNNNGQVKPDPAVVWTSWSSGLAFGHLLDYLGLEALSCLS